MIIKILVGFALLILFSVGPQLAPVKQDVMDEKAAEYKLAVFAAEFQRVYPSLDDYFRGPVAASGADAIVNVLPDYGFAIDTSSYYEEDGFRLGFGNSNDRITNPLTGEKIQGEYLILKQKTNKGEKLKVVEFGSNKICEETY